MNSRLEKILRLVLNNNSNANIGNISKMFGLSKRSIENDINEINIYLKELNQPYLFFDDYGSLKSTGDLNNNFIRKSLDNFDPIQYKFTVEERAIYIYLILSWNSDYLSMESLAKSLNVTRVTILNDIKRLDKKISYETKIISNPGKGIKLDFCDYIRLNDLINIFEKYKILQENTIFNSFIIKNLNIKFSFNEILYQAREYFNIKNLVIDEITLTKLILYIFIVFNSHNKEYKDLYDNSLKCEETSSLIYFLSIKLGFKIYDSHILNYNKFISCNNIDSVTKRVDDLDLYSVIKYFLVKLDKQTQSNLSLDDILIESLIMHIRHLRDWGVLDFDISDIDKSIANFSGLKKAVIDNVYIIESYLRYKLSDNMIKSIIIHICVSLIRNDGKNYEISVLIVCPGSMATGKLLELQLNKYFNFTIKGIVTIEYLGENRSLLKDIDFIITTVDLGYFTSNYIKVNPILNMDDMNNLQRVAVKKKENKKNKGLDIYKISLKEKNDTLNIMGKILEKNILINEETITWREAILQAAQPLLDKKYIDKTYVKKAIENIEEYGDYIIIGYGVAIAHAGKDSGVYTDSLSLLVSRAPIKFSNSENPVYFLFFFASDGSNDYKQLYEILIKIGRNKDFVEKMHIENSEIIYNTLVSLK